MPLYSLEKVHFYRSLPWLHFGRQTITSSTGNKFIAMLHVRSSEHQTAASFTACSSSLPKHQTQITGFIHRGDFLIAQTNQCLWLSDNSVSTLTVFPHSLSQISKQYIQFLHMCRRENSCLHFAPRAHGLLSYFSSKRSNSSQLQNNTSIILGINMQHLKRSLRPQCRQVADGEAPTAMPPRLLVIVLAHTPRLDLFSTNWTQTNMHILILCATIPPLLH